jgi:hypothetical protein
VLNGLPPKLLFAATCLAWVGAATSNVSARVRTTGCANYVVIDSRGSGETSTLSAPGGVFYGFFKAAVSKRDPSARVAVIPNGYPACSLARSGSTPGRRIARQGTATRGRTLASRAALAAAAAATAGRRRRRGRGRDRCRHSHRWPAVLVIVEVEGPTRVLWAAETDADRDRLHSWILADYERRGLVEAALDASDQERGRAWSAALAHDEPLGKITRR